MKGASLRRQQRHSNQPSVTQGCDAPVSLVFRTHSESLSKAAFLFCPKNFNLSNPTTAASAGSPSSPGGVAGASAARHGAGVYDASPSSPSAKRFAASTSPTTTAAPAATAESVQTLVEAIIELRPFFPAAAMHASASTMNLSMLSPSSPLGASHTSTDQSPPLNPLLTRPSSNASLGLGSYVDLMSLSSFASPTVGGSAGGAAHFGNGSFNVSSAGGSRFGDAAHVGGSPRTAAPVGGVHGFPTATPHSLAGSVTGVGGAAVAGSTALGGGGTAAAPTTTAAAAGGAGLLTGGGGQSTLMHPSGGWICRAMAFNEKEVSHANGAISVSQALTSKCPLINEVAKGKMMARILTSYAEVQERFGLSHVELTVDNQYVSRSDLFLISEALRERILYEGEEIHVCNFRIRVREMLQTVALNAFAPASCSAAIPVSGAAGAAASGQSGGPGGVPSSTTYVRVGCGIVLPSTRINFQSLSPVHYVLVELSREMWETTIDGRIALTWAIRKFISELLLKQLPKRKASPLIRVVFTGRLHKEFQFGRHSDIFHLLELPREARNVDVVEEIRMHCEALVDRVLREVHAAAYQQLEMEVAAYREGGEALHGNPTSPTQVQPDADTAFESYVRGRQAYIDAITAKRIFVHAKQSNTLEALSILLERCTHHYIDRHLTLCGHAVTVVSAGKGFYQVTNSLVQIVCARLHDMGLEKVHVVCIGRPPLHVTPLLEYTSEDDTLRSQYHLHSRVLSSTAGREGWRDGAAVERYYETPEWMSVFFFHSALHNNGGETVFELLPKECWQREHPLMTALGAMWTSPAQQPSAQSSPVNNGDGGEAEGHGSGPDVDGGAEPRSSDVAEGPPFDTPVSTAAAAHAHAPPPPPPSGVTAGAPLLIPGLGLRSYPVPDVTLPVRSASVVPDVAEGEARNHHVGGAAAMMTVNGGIGTPTHPLRPYLPDVLEMSATASYGTDHATSPTSPFSHHAVGGLNGGGRRSGFGPGGGRVSPIFSTAGAASSPLLVRTTTASSSVFASPNIPARGSMPRGGGGGASAAPAWRDHHHILHGLNNSHSLSHPQIAHHGGSAFPAPAPLQRHPGSATSLTLSAAGGGMGGGGGGGGGAVRRGELGGLASAQRRVRGQAAASGAAGSHATGRVPAYMSSSSIAGFSAGPFSGAGTGGGSSSRRSHPNSLTSYSTSSHPPLHVSRSFDYKTTANPGYHSLGALEHSVRSAGSSYAGRQSPSSLPAATRSLLYRDGNAGKSSMNSLVGLPAVAATATTGAAAPTATAHVTAAAMPESAHARDGVCAAGVVGPVAVCAWYCLHAAKPHLDGGGGGGGGQLGSGAAATGAATAAAGRQGGNVAWQHGASGGEAADAATATAAAALAPCALPAVLPVTKPWHKAPSSTRADAVYCGCNVVDSDLRNGYLILEITIDAAALPNCFWAPRVIIDDKGWGELMGSFTGRDDRLTGDAEFDFYSDDEDAMEQGDSMTIGGGSGASSVDGRVGATHGGRASAAALGVDAHDPAGAAGARETDSSGGGGGEAYRFQSDFRPSEAFCRSHSGISPDGRTLIIPTHNNSVHFQSSEEILLRLQPQLFVTAVDDGGDAAVQHRGPVSPTSSHHVVENDDDNGGGSSAADTRETRGLSLVAGASDAFVDDAVKTATPPPPAPSPHAGDAAAAPPMTTTTAVDASLESPKRSSSPPRAAHDPTSPASPATTAAAVMVNGGSGSSQPTPKDGDAAMVAAAPARPLPLHLPPTGGSSGSSGGAAVAAVKAEVPHELGHPHSRHQHHGSPQVCASPCYVAHAPAAAPSAFVAGVTVTVGFVQLRNSLLFAIKPINPLRPSADEDPREDVAALAQSAESASTATVLRRRWQWRHPDIASEPPHLASWTRLCTCRLLPLYGSKPAYPREGFYTVSPHQYTVTNPASASGHADVAEERKRLLEFVLQRLQQQYQIVVDGPGLTAGAQWPRADPTPNARLEMSLGHQTHTLKVGETAKTISVTRMLHRGMYSNGQVTHMLSYRYLLWNYLADDFATREVHMEAQVGERNAFRWESLDRWLQERPEVYIPRGPDLWLRSREVAVMLLPEDPANPPSFDEFHRFIGYRFSVHLSTHGKVEWMRHSNGVVFDISETTPQSFPPAPALMDVVLVHDNPLTLDTRNVMDRVTGRTLAFDVPVEERLMSVDVSLPQQYDAHCCYFLKVSWLVCAASVVVDWFGSFIANASRFHFHAVPMCCYYNSPKAESLTAHYDVEAATTEEEPALRRVLAELLLTPAYRYYPDTPTITRNCRLVHLSGLCCVILPPSATTVAQWYQNACVRQGSVEQLELLMQFKEAEALARQRVAVTLAGAAPN